MNNTVRTVLICIVIVAALSGVYFITNDYQSEAASAAKGTESIATTTTEFTLKIQGRSIVEGASTLSVKQGDTVVIHITADEAEEFHVHAYNNSVELEQNVETTLTFVANASGRFPFELEKSGTEIGAIEVLPQ